MTSVVNWLFDLAVGGGHEAVTADDRKPPAPSAAFAIAIPSDEETDEDDDDVVLCSVQNSGPLNPEQQEAWYDAMLAAALKKAQNSTITKPSPHDNTLNPSIGSEASESMYNHAGLSFLFVKQVIKMLEPYKKDGIEPVGIDDAVFLCEKLYGLQKAWKLQNQEPVNQKEIPTHVCVGYHYTHPQNLDSIRFDGLLTIQDRKAAKHANQTNRAYFGNGIYTGNNPEAFCSYGEVGLMVAVLKGNEQYVGQTGQNGKKKPGKHIHTTVGDKQTKQQSNSYSNEIVLKSSEQVLPLVKYPTSKLFKKGRAKQHQPDEAFLDILWEVHQKMQRIFDDYFNDSVETNVLRLTKWAKAETARNATAKKTRRTKRTKAQPAQKIITNKKRGNPSTSSSNNSSRNKRQKLAHGSTAPPTGQAKTNGTSNTQPLPSGPRRSSRLGSVAATKAKAPTTMQLKRAPTKPATANPSTRTATPSSAPRRSNRLALLKATSTVSGAKAPKQQTTTKAPLPSLTTNGTSSSSSSQSAPPPNPACPRRSSRLKPPPPGTFITTTKSATGRMKGSCGSSRTSSAAQHPRRSSRLAGNQETKKNGK